MSLGRLREDKVLLHGQKGGPEFFLPSLHFSCEKFPTALAQTFFPRAVWSVCIPAVYVRVLLSGLKRGTHFFHRVKKVKRGKRDFLVLPKVIIRGL